MLETRTDAVTRIEYAPGTEIAPGRHLLRTLGGGTRYEVHLAWDERLFALAVAKVLRREAAADPRGLAELGREADLLSRLAHPALVRGFGAVRDGAYPHVLLEHVEGPTLKRLVVRDGPLALAQLLPLALSVVAVLHYLSGEGVAHLDVKPGNIVVGVPPRLIDLSIARPVAEAARLRAAIGTDPYMAPEQCDPSRAPVGPAADVWALGATLHQAATGQVPFPRAKGARESHDPRERFPQLVRRAEPPEGLPPAFGQLVADMLAPDPGDRPTAADVADALEPLVAAIPDRLRPARRGFLPP